MSNHHGQGGSIGSLRNRIRDIIDSDLDSSLAAKAYNVAITVLIIVSLVPLEFKNGGGALEIIDMACVAAFA